MDEGKGEESARKFSADIKRATRQLIPRNRRSNRKNSK
jgi:hypothetical protein